MTVFQLLISFSSFKSSLGLQKGENANVPSLEEIESGSRSDLAPHLKARAALLTMQPPPSSEL